MVIARWRSRRLICSGPLLIVTSAKAPRGTNWPSFVPIGSVCRLICRQDGNRVIEGEVIGFHDDRCLLIPCGKMQGLSAGDPVIYEGQRLYAKVGTALLGRVIDARAPERYEGRSEPLDPVAGHIPGAHNLYWQSQLNDSGVFDSFATLHDAYARILGDASSERVVCYCGSGVTACHLLLAMHACGLSGAQLYVGSWSEWCRQKRPCESRLWH